MQLVSQTKVRSILSTLVGALLAGALSACGGGSSGSDVKEDFSEKPVNPPSETTYVERLGIDTKLPSSSSGLLRNVFIDSNANITFQNTDPHSLIGNYRFTFPSGLAGGSVTGNFFTFINNDANTEVNILTPGTTKTVQNVFWRNISDPSLFGFGLPGYVNHPHEQNLPVNGIAKFAGKSFQYIVDSNLNRTVRDQTTYALYVSDVTAIVDYAQKSVAVSVASNPTFISAIGEAAVINSDPSRFATNYIVNDFESDGVQIMVYSDSESPSTSGFGLTAEDQGTALFGSKAEELGGYIHYSGDVTLPSGLIVRRDQFISFALVKQ